MSYVTLNGDEYKEISRSDYEEPEEVEPVISSVKRPSIVPYIHYPKHKGFLSGKMILILAICAAAYYLHKKKEI